MTKRTIAELKTIFKRDEVDESLLQSLQKDERKGVQKLVANYYKNKRIQKQQEKVYKQMCLFEKRAYQKGYEYIAGIDEAGRGPLAGPVVAAAVILPDNFTLIGLNDSKQLTASKRNTYFTYIQEKAISYGIGIVDSEVIDQINIFNATKLAMTKAINSLQPAADYLLIDAVNLERMPIKQEAIIKGDAKSITIAAASVLAKVTRDQIMQQIHKEYPQYDFSNNMGYGTKNHLKALENFGLSPHHRKSFAPVKNVL